MITIRHILESARDLIDSPEKHCVGRLAVDRHGRACATNSRSARRWCAIGAIYGAMRVDSRGILNLKMRAAFDALEDASGMLYGKGIAHMNDNKGFNVVQRIYARAINDCAP